MMNKQMDTIGKHIDEWIENLYSNGWTDRRIDKWMLVLHTLDKLGALGSLPVSMI